MPVSGCIKQQNLQNDMKILMTTRSMRPINAILATLTLSIHAEQAPPAGGLELFDLSAPVSHRVKEGASAEKIPVVDQTFTTATRVTMEKPSPREP